MEIERIGYCLFYFKETITLKCELVLLHTNCSARRVKINEYELTNVVWAQYADAELKQQTDLDGKKSK